MEYRVRDAASPSGWGEWQPIQCRALSRMEADHKSIERLLEMYPDRRNFQIRNVPDGRRW
jgi:hypothetical protein